jgi:biotin transport system substrate-specific component
MQAFTKHVGQRIQVIGDDYLVTRVDLIEAAVRDGACNAVLLKPNPVGTLSETRSAMLAAVAYLSLGLFQLPVFHGGGGAGYLFNPGFGYLAGFLPAAWITGKLASQRGMGSLIGLVASCAVGLGVMQLCGVANLLLGALVGQWRSNLGPLLVSYSLAPLIPQLLLICAVAVVALPLRRLVLVEP